MRIMNSQDEQLINIKLCICLHKLAMETNKSLREAYESDHMADSMI